MNQRERLIELLKGAETKVTETLSTALSLEEWLGIYADHLLANGVTAMPEKVYWYNMGGKLVEAKVHNEKIIAEIDGGLEYVIPHKEIGKTVFMSRAEAEAELERRKK